MAATPVDTSGQPLGKPIFGRCRDVASGGIAVFLPERTDARFLQLEPVGGSLWFFQKTIEVLRIRNRNGEFEIAGQVVTLPLGSETGNAS